MSKITEAVFSGEAGSPQLFQLSEPCESQQIDFFISHSWHDEGTPKFDALQEWKATFPTDAHPTIWLDVREAVSNASSAECHV